MIERASRWSDDDDADYDSESLANIFTASVSLVLLLCLFSRALLPQRLLPIFARAPTPTPTAYFRLSFDYHLIIIWLRDNQMIIR